MASESGLEGVAIVEGCEGNTVWQLRECYYLVEAYALSNSLVIFDHPATFSGLALPPHHGTT